MVKGGKIMSGYGIFTDVKSGLGLDPEDAGFDSELLFSINAAISLIRQQGVGVDLEVKDDKAKWNDFIPNSSSELLGMVKEFVRLHVKIIFDPPAPSTLKVMEEMKSELIWRMHVSFEEVENVSQGIST